MQKSLWIYLILELLYFHFIRKFSQEIESTVSHFNFYIKEIISEVIFDNKDNSYACFCLCFI